MAELFAKYNCTNCQESIQGIRVHCAECTDYFVLCLQCFAAGAEIGNHRNDHAYQFYDAGILSIYRGKTGWTAREEMHLLDAIEQFGFGNWEDISRHIETRSPEDAKEEYINKFLNGTIGRHTWQSSDSIRPYLVDHTIVNDTGPLSQNLTQRLPPLNVTPEEAAQLGYMPNRDDFDREYDPTAEQLVSTSSLSPDDEEVDFVLKLAQVDIYTRRLRERARRKRLVRDYQLVASFFHGGQRNRARQQTRDQRDFRDRFRVFAQFYTSLEFDRMLVSLEREKSLRCRLSELSRYRWNGLTKVDECVHFEQHAASAQHKNTGPYGNGRTDNRLSGERPGLSTHSHLKKGDAGATTNSNSIGQKSMHHIAGQAYSDGSSLNKSSSDSYRGAGLLHQQSQQDPAIQPGGPLLSSNEIKLCTSLNLPPTRYITLKTVLLSGASLNTPTPQENFVKKYLMKAGWLSSASSS